VEDSARTVLAMTRWVGSMWCKKPWEALRRQRRPWEPNLPCKERRQPHISSGGHRWVQFGRDFLDGLAQTQSAMQNE